MKKILHFSPYFCDWLESCNGISERNVKLTKETFTALHHTTNAFLELTKYCIELIMSYILPSFQPKPTLVSKKTKQKKNEKQNNTNSNTNNR